MRDNDPDHARHHPSGLSETRRRRGAAYAAAGRLLHLLPGETDEQFRARVIATAPPPDRELIDLVGRLLARPPAARPDPGPSAER